MYALYTFHWDFGHSNCSEPVWQTFAQETSLEANLSVFPKGTSASSAWFFLCTTFRTLVWVQERDQVRHSCGHKAFVCGFQMLCQLAREIYIICIFYEIILTLTILGLLDTCSKTQATAIKSIPKSKMHLACVPVVMMNPKGYLLPVLLLYPREGHASHTAGYLSCCYLVHCLSACGMDSKFPICEDSM